MSIIVTTSWAKLTQSPLNVRISGSRTLMKDGASEEGVGKESMTLFNSGATPAYISHHLVS